jgi:hypothetical protein
MWNRRPPHKLTPGAFRGRLWLLAGLGLGAAVIAFVLPPIPQDPAYHNFADQRGMLGIPHFLNVVSNIPFVLVGVLGLHFLSRRTSTETHEAFMAAWERWPFVVFFIGIAWTGLGSAYYHLAPANETLVWDRLPITVAFMSLFTAITAERIGADAGRWLFIPLLAAGAASVLYWHWGQLGGAGDLRMYGLVQYGSFLAISAMLVLFPARYTRTADLWGAMGLYGLAKAFELFDARVFALGHLVSGHTLKHLAAAAAAYGILRMLRTRRPMGL